MGFQFVLLHFEMCIWFFADIPSSLLSAQSCTTTTCLRPRRFHTGMLYAEMQRWGLYIHHIRRGRERDRCLFSAGLPWTPKGLSLADLCFPCQVSTTHLHERIDLELGCHCHEFQGIAIRPCEMLFSSVGKCVMEASRAPGYAWMKG